VILSLAAPKSRTDGSPLEEPVVLRLTLLRESHGPHAKAPRRRTKLPGATAERPVASSWIVPMADWAAYAAANRIEIPIAIADLDLPKEAEAAAAGGRQISFVAEVQEGKRWKSLPAGPVSLSLCNPPPAPTFVDARTSPGGILVTWNNSGADSVPIQVYRSEGDAGFGEHPYRSLPPGATTFLDEATQMGAGYRYQVRLGHAADPNRCESEKGGDAAATRLDFFPPARPQGLAAAAEEALIRLFWTPGPEPDIAGYLVYRSDGPDQPFHLLTAKPIAATTYADPDVRKGKRYTYVVSAVDGAQPPNESVWSEPAEETMP